MSAPVIQAGYLPAQHAPLAEQEQLAHEITDAVIIVLRLIAAQGKLHWRLFLPA